MGLLAEAYERCRGPEDEGEPALDRDGFKRLVRDLDLWSSSCMVAFDGRNPVGVLFGAKRPESTLVHTLRVHPEHRRRGHGRHLLTSLSQKLAILGPPRLLAEVPAGREAACATFSACGWHLEDRLTDWRRPGGQAASASPSSRSSEARPGGEGAAHRETAREAIAPLTLADLEASGLLQGRSRCWRRDLPGLAKRREGLTGLAFHSLDGIEAWVLWDEAEPDGPRPLLSLGAAPGDLGRLGLSVVLDEVSRRSGESPLFLARAAPAELDPRLLRDLGFQPGAEYLLFTRSAQAA